MISQIRLNEALLGVQEIVMVGVAPRAALRSIKNWASQGGVRVVDADEPVVPHLPGSMVPMEPLWLRELDAVQFQVATIPSDLVEEAIRFGDWLVLQGMLLTDAVREGGALLRVLLQTRKPDDRLSRMYQQFLAPPAAADPTEHAADMIVAAANLVQSEALGLQTGGPALASRLRAGATRVSRFAPDPPTASAPTPSSAPRSLARVEEFGFNYRCREGTPEERRAAIKREKDAHARVQQGRRRSYGTHAADPLLAQVLPAFRVEVAKTHSAKTAIRWGRAIGRVLSRRDGRGPSKRGLLTLGSRQPFFVRAWRIFYKLATAQGHIVTPYPSPAEAPLQIPATEDRAEHKLLARTFDFVDAWAPTEGPSARALVLGAFKSIRVLADPEAVRDYHDALTPPQRVSFRRIWRRLIAFCATRGWTPPAVAPVVKPRVPAVVRTPEAVNRALATLLAMRIPSTSIAQARWNHSVISYENVRYHTTYQLVQPKSVGVQGSSLCYPQAGQDFNAAIETLRQWAVVGLDPTPNIPLVPVRPGGYIGLTAGMIRWTARATQGVTPDPETDED